VDTIIVTTAFDVPGYKIVKVLGLIRGIVCRSRSFFGTFGGALQTLVGGNITLFTELCEKTRKEAYEIMIANAKAANANAVIGMRYDSTEVLQGVTEVLAYGTAVIIEKI
jgi:uncharacterized protein YbjQ (UPF0145 family)